MEKERYLVTERDEFIDALIKTCMPDFDSEPDLHGVDFDFI
jgi:hypothetical protein